MNWIIDWFTLLFNWIKGLNWHINWGTVTSIIVGLGAAAIGQIIAHHFSQKREDLKFNKDCFQNLFSPVFLKVHQYIQKESWKSLILNSKTEEEYEKNLQNEHDNPKVIFSEIIEILDSNLKYASPELTLIYQETIALPKIDKELDGWASPKIIFCNQFLMEYIKLSKDLEVYSPKIKELAEEDLVFTQLVTLLSRAKKDYLADGLVQHLEFIKSEFIKSLKDKYLDKLIRINLKYDNVTSDEDYKRFQKKAMNLLRNIGNSLPEDLSEWWNNHIDD
ncbi:hypothetical protein [Bacillus atrophaeus]|uniref:hypothetical protein n=1 Tax=Bacillus atrophaeus TaxID=1452 RepID=UPI001157EC0B|nr:hypothetical protein [Bacillus atrophaeus]